MGYHAVYFDLDTEGYLHDSTTEIQVSKDIWDDTVPGTNPCRNSFLQIEHDIHYQTVYNLTSYTLDSLFKSGYRSVTVGQCLGDPPANWYRAGSKAVPSYTFTTRAPTGTWSCLTQTATPTSSGPASPSSTLQVSTDGSCGSGVTCQGSTYGNCKYPVKSPVGCIAEDNVQAARPTVTVAHPSTTVAQVAMPNLALAPMATAPYQGQYEMLL